MITRTFKLCLNAGTGSAPYINVSQYDEGETWLFELYSETGERYIPTTGAIVGVKSDGHGIANTGTVDSEGRVVIAETQQMTASAGRAIYELSIDGLTHGTANFIVAVERKPTDDAVMSDSDLSLIQEAIDSAEVIVEVIGDGDPSEVIGEHVDAWLDNHPEATTTVEDGAITAPKINQSLWDKLLVSEEASGAVASFEDGADDVPVSSLKVNLEPIQTGSGDPSPSNVRPIIASNGKNLIELDDYNYTAYGVTFKYENGIGKITLSGTASETISQIVKEVSVKTGTYVLNGVTSGSNTTYYMRVRDKNNTSNAVVNTTTDASITFASDTVAQIQVFVYGGANLGTGVSFYPMLRTTGTDATFQPYQGIMVERCGKNLLNPSLLTVFGQTYISTVNYNTVGSIAVSPSASYTISFASGVGDGRIYQYDASGNAIGSALQFTLQSYTFTTNANCKTIGFRYKFTDESATVADAKAQLELGNTASEYEPYTGTSYPYTLGQSVYGGTVDLATGVLTVTWGTITLDGSEAWGVGSTDQGFYTSAHTMLKASDYTSVILCDKLKTYERMNKSDYYGATNGITGYNDGSNQYPTQNWIYAKGGGATTPAEFKTWLASNPLQVVYLLATPQTIQLTPTEVKTLLGYNNISSTGTVDVIYHADTKLYVDKMTNVDNSVIAPTEADFVATRNYTVNDLVIVNDTLYKVTSNIQNGGTITPNSNVTATTLATLIKALS